MKRNSVLIGIGISAAILITALYWGSMTLINHLLNPKVDAENLVLKDFATSQYIRLSFSEKPTVLQFFTSWCPYCNEDAPKIVALHEKYKDRVNIIGIDPIYKDDVTEVQSYISLHRIKYPILLDETGDTYGHFKEPGFPALYFINTKGKIVDSIIGSAEDWVIEDRFKSLIEG